jgi:two-component system, chemotaxis family, sensor kinase Cph1
LGIEGKLLYQFEINQKQVTGMAHIKDGYLILELESSVSGQSFIELYQEIKFAMTAIETAEDSHAACKIVADELKKISGFDKVMIYRFDEDWNGEVIAEVMEEGMESYLGLKFPSSDIPKQARELYKRSPYRLIPNVDYEPVRIYPVINPITNSFTDLSDTNLRSVATVHLEYLRNMQVTASMSTRILKGDQLWGLIACHHRNPKYLSYEMGSVFELLSNMISSKIASALDRDLFVHRNEKQQLYNALVEEVYRHSDLFGALITNEQKVLKLLSADGVLIRLNNKTESFGSVPSRNDSEALLDWLQYNGFSKIHHQPGLSKVYEHAKEFSKEASGILVLPVQPEKGNYILAFRKEELQQVNWGGNPAEAVKMEADGIKYHPRASFKIWQQRVEEASTPWKPEEIEVAEQFRNFVIEATLNKVYS